jgi:hypothetical protein
MKYLMYPVIFILITLFVYVASGYSGVMRDTAPLYDTDDNIPFMERKVFHVLNYGDLIRINACYDDKSDYYFFVSRDGGGETGFLYNLRMEVKKNKRLPSINELWYAIENPLVVIQCSSMVKNVRAIEFH